MLLPQLGQMGARGLPHLPQNLSKGTRCQWQDGHCEPVAPTLPSRVPHELQCRLPAVFSFQQLGQRKFCCMIISNAANILCLF
jgi:hypothetical protein